MSTIIFGNYADPGWTSAPVDGWWNYARCRDEDPRMFEPMPMDIVGNMKALAVCEACPLWVKKECLKEALDTADITTVRGGTTPDQRIEIRQQKAIADLKAARAALTAAQLPARPRCDKGHEQNADTTYMSGDGYLCCKPCRVENQREYRQRRNAREAAERQLVKAGAA